MNPLPSHHRQRGMVSTLIAVVVLLVTLLAAAALMRSVDTSNTVAGTLAFKQSAADEAEIAYKDALNNASQFSGQGVGESDIPGAGYFAEIQPVNSQGIPTALAAGTAGKTLSNLPGMGADTIVYIVERLCPNSGQALTVPPNQCVVPSPTGTGGSATGNQGGFNAGALPGYRLTVRVNGQKNIVTYVQTFLH